MYTSSRVSLLASTRTPNRATLVSIRVKDNVHVSECERGYTKRLTESVRSSSKDGSNFKREGIEWKRRNVTALGRTLRRTGRLAFDGDVLYALF